MSKDELYEINQRFLQEELIPSPKAGRGMYCCPSCGSGNGPKGTGAVGIYTNKDGKRKAHCLSCGEDMDIIDVISKSECVSPSEAAKIALQKYGAGVGAHRSSAAEDFGPDHLQQKKSVAELPHNTINYQDYVLACKSAYPGSVAERYVQGRGITLEMARRFSLGYDPTSGSGGDGALVIPYDKRGRYYIQRVISPLEGRPHHLKPKNAPGGSGGFLFNEAALYGEDPCFVVESPLCAISIVQCGGKAACALVGTNWNPLRDAIEKRKPTAPLILCLDNDAEKDDGSRPGQDNQARLAAYLTGAGVAFTENCVQGDYKDPNEALQKDPQGLAERVALALEICRNSVSAAEQEKLSAYEESSMSAYVDVFTEAVAARKNEKAPSTGFKELDKILGGGMYPGLYAIGAISSLGKTAFLGQICDNLSGGGCDVLFFSLEMGREEMLSRSLSRITHELAMKKRFPAGMARTSREILNGSLYANYTPEVLGLIADAKDEYKKKIAPRIWIFEGFGSIGVQDIIDAAEKHIAITGRKPVVVVDYLQILAPQDPRLSDKQNTDRNVLALKRLSRDRGLAVFCVSSLNRDNYSEPINMAAFKESGAIEYGTDVLIGIQAHGYDFEKNEKETDRKKRISDLVEANNEKARKGEAVRLDVKVLKNRSGYKGNVGVMFTSKYFYFSEIPAGFEPVAEKKAGAKRPPVL